MIKITCPHCSQHLELDSETLIALESASHFDCPTCGGAVEVPAPVLVPAKQAPPRREGKTTPERVVRGTEQGMNRNFLVLGVVALLAIGGVAIFLASKSGGNVFNLFQNTTNQIINNSYFTQLIADGKTTKEDLEAIAEIRPYGDGFIGVSKEALTWEQSQGLARRTGSEVLSVEDSPTRTQQQLIDWLKTTFSSQFGPMLWVQDGGQAKVTDGHEVLGVSSLGSSRKLALHWSPNVGQTTTDPALAAKEKPFVNSLGMKFVPVLGTKVLFCIHETRRQDYAVYGKQNPSAKGNWETPVLDKSPLVGMPFEQHPVALVSRDDAESFCKWLSGQGQLRYRLPTDEEWSKAADFDEPRTSTDTPDDLHKKAISGNAARIYPWGAEWPPPANAGNYSGEFTPSSDSFPTTSPVLSFRANKHGLHDMGGNLWEWVSDRYWNKEPLHGTLRGGAWGPHREWDMRSGCRFGERHNVGFSVFGFRVVLELPDEKASVSAPGVAATPASPAS